MPAVETNGIETYYESVGNGQPVVLVHGATSDHQLWGRQVESLAGEYQVVTYDVRDHGRTGASDREYTIDLLAEDLQALIEALDLATPVVCGHSMGGFIAQQHAVTHPGEAAGYVFADTWTPETFTLRERVVVDVLAPAYATATEIAGYNRLHEAAEWVFEQLHHEEIGADEAAVEQLQEDPVELTDERGTRILKAVNSWKQASIDLTGIAVPVLFLYGEHEPDYLTPHVGRMATEIDDFRAYRIPDAGHSAHVDNPDAFTRHLRTFLERVYST